MGDGALLSFVRSGATVPVPSAASLSDVPRATRAISCDNDDTHTARCSNSVASTHVFDTRLSRGVGHHPVGRVWQSTGPLVARREWLSLA